MDSKIVKKNLLVVVKWVFPFVLLVNNISLTNTIQWQ